MKFILLLIILCCVSSFAQTKYYTGLGLSYHRVSKPNDAMNANFPSLNLHIDNRTKCKIWYGLGVNMGEIGKQSEAPISSEFFNYFFMLEPNIRYNFISNNTNNYNFVPYVKGALLLGYLDADDNLSDRSLGGSFGVGLAKGFDAFGQCFMIDLNAQYSGFNTIYRVDGRQFFETFNFNLYLSVKL